MRRDGIQLSRAKAAYAVSVVIVLIAAGCGAHHASKSASLPATPAPPAAPAQARASTANLDMQTVEGCFNGGGENTHEAPDYPWLDLISLRHQALLHGLGAFSTFGESGTDEESVYFFRSSQQAKQMLKQANKGDRRIRVVGNVVTALYTDLTPSQAALQKRCVG